MTPRSRARLTPIDGVLYTAVVGAWGRRSRNPRTGQPMDIPPKTTLHFRFVKTFKEAVLPPATAAPKKRRGERGP